MRQDIDTALTGGIRTRTGLQFPGIIPGGPFDAYISLGLDCEVSHQLRRARLQTIGLPFDWLVTPFEGLCITLENNFKGFLDRDRLRFSMRVDPDGAVFRCVEQVETGIQFHHAFPNSPYFLAGYEEAQGKYARRIKSLRMLLLSGARVAFIRTDITREQAVRLHAILRRTFPRLSCVLVVVGPGEHLKADWGLEDTVNVHIPDVQPGPDKWEGNYAGYAELFSRLHEMGAAGTDVTSSGDRRLFSRENE